MRRMTGKRLRAGSAWLAGWLVLWPASLWGATLYTNDGFVSPRLEAERWLINRARFAPEREADRLGLTNALPGGHPDYDVCENTNTPNDFGPTTNEWRLWTLARGPLAPNERLSRAAATHARDMAETGVFSHYSPSGKYYPLGSDPSQRARQEGYTNTITGYYENLAWGARGSTIGYPAYGETPQNVHGGLFVDNTAISRGHRQAILNANATEIGLGAYRTNSYDGYYWTEDYDVQDFGRNGTNHFFTDTLFHDANTNGVYDEGEGVGGIAIRLWDGANEAARFDCSQSSGSMAIPINDLPDGRWIEVRLQNTNAATQRLSIPLGWSTLGEIELTNNEIFSAGYFRQPYGITNLGFRNLEPLVTTSISRTGAQYRIGFSAFTRVNYRIEYNTNGAGPTWTTLTILTATNEQIQTADPAGASAVRIYRTLIVRD